MSTHPPRGRRGAADAFESLFAPHREKLYRLALRLTGNADDAEDLLQEVTAHLYARTATVSAVDRLRPWLMRVLYRHFVDRWRRDHASPVTFQGDDLPDPPAPAEAAPEAEFERGLTRERLQQALDRLPAQQREILLLHDVEGHTLPEVAEVMGIALGTLKSRLHRARERLRTLLGPADGGTFRSGGA